MTFITRHICRMAILSVVLHFSSGLQAALLGHWQFNEQSGSVTKDAAGNNDGTLIGDAAIVAGGVSGNAVHMSRVGGGFVHFGDIFDFVASDFSLSLWAKTPPGDEQEEHIIAGRHVARSNNGYFIGLNAFLNYSRTGSAWFYMSSGPGFEPKSTTLVNDGEWHHLVATYQRDGNVTLYIDGVAEASLPTTPIIRSQGDFRVGGYMFDGLNVSRFNGYVDELSVYDHTLSQKEVQLLYENFAQQEPVFEINPGLSDAWFFPTTGGQGFFIIVWEDRKEIFLAWFTYDTERPPEDVIAILGEPGHRWLTGQGVYEGDTALLDVFLTSGMVFDSTQPPVTSEQLEGATIEIVWSGCNEGIVKYDIPSLGLMDDIPIERIVLDNVPACMAAQTTVNQ